jgi:Asp/Glu/hydantoin racemase
MTACRILLVNPNTTASITAALARFADSALGHRAALTAVTAPFGAAALETEADLAVAGKAVLAAIAEHPAHDVAIIAAFGDPGLAEARATAPMPVLGIGEAGFRAAAAHGRRFAVVTVGEAMRGAIEGRARGLGLGGQMTGVTIVAGRVLDVAADPTALDEQLLAAAGEAVSRDGAEAILVGGAPFAGVGQRLGRRLPVPIFDGVSAALAAALQIGAASQRCAVSQFGAR